MPRDIDHRMVGEGIPVESSGHPLYSAGPITQVDRPSTDQRGSAIPSPIHYLIPPKLPSAFTLGMYSGGLITSVTNSTRGAAPAVPDEECAHNRKFAYVQRVHASQATGPAKRRRRPRTVSMTPGWSSPTPCQPPRPTAPTRRKPRPAGE